MLICTDRLIDVLKHGPRDINISEYVDIQFKVILWKEWVLQFTIFDLVFTSVLPWTQFGIAHLVLTTIYNTILTILTLQDRRAFLVGLSVSLLKIILAVIKDFEYFTYTLLF